MTVGDSGACSQEVGKNSLCLVMVVRWLLNARRGAAQGRRGPIYRRTKAVHHRARG
jgi:hypothetical protein